MTVRDDFNTRRVELEGLNEKANSKLKEYTTALPFKVEHMTWTRGDGIRIQLAEGGGFVAMLRKSTKGTERKK